MPGRSFDAALAAGRSAMALQRLKAGAVIGIGIAMGAGLFALLILLAG